jgi:thiol-disulfide isomerase/thioredoxin
MIRRESDGFESVKGAGWSASSLDRLIRKVHPLRAILRLLCLLLFVLVVPMLRAAPAPSLDYLKVGHQFYSNVTVLGANATDLYFTSDRGISNVKLRLLDPKLQKRFHFDPEAAAEIEKQQENDDKQYYNSIASNMIAKAEQVALAARKAAMTSPENIADPISDRSLLGKAAPVWELDKWLTAKPNLTNKFVLLAFWEPWSIPCQKAIPELNALQKRFAETLVVVGITSEPESGLAGIRDMLEFPSAIDLKGQVSTAANVVSIPHTLLLDPNRIVLYHGHPALLDERKLQSLMARASGSEGELQR